MLLELEAARHGRRAHATADSLTTGIRRFELTSQQSPTPRQRLSPQAVQDTAYCQGNVRTLRAGPAEDDAAAGSGIPPRRDTRA